MWKAFCDEKEESISMVLDGVVTLYNPELDVLGNIESYIGCLRNLYVFDNSEDVNTHIKQCLENKPNVIYVSFNKNKGIAEALNYVLDVGQDTKFLLTMDQDTSFPTGMMEAYIAQVEMWEKLNPNEVAIYSVRIMLKHGMVDEYSKSPEYIDCTITSGNIVSVSAARRVGGYNNDLFIDEVDSDFSLAIRQCGYKILRFNNMFINHLIGDVSKEQCLWFSYNTSNHSPIRRYYMMRNRLYMMKKYSKIRRAYGISLLKIIIKVILAEKEKCKKLKYMFLGMYDFLFGNMGKYKR